MQKGNDFDNKMWYIIKDRNTKEVLAMNISRRILSLLLSLAMLVPLARWGGADASAPKEDAAQDTAKKTEEPAAEEEDADDSWMLMLVNGENPLPEGYEAPELTKVRTGHYVDSRIYDALQEMLSDARAAGVSPVICSSYRTWAGQTKLYNNQVRLWKSWGYIGAAAEAKAATWVARPGTSEHQTGLALDIVDLYYQGLYASQANTATQKWLMAHCAESGFILRSPKDKVEITGVNYEPWHYRYVGVEAAKEITESGVCLEEYLEALEAEKAEAEATKTAPVAAVKK